ncbi:PepSY domain-containing protein [Polaribacter sp. MED152]|uniref:PepSY-associated TM helix domain-containing protein n=1 Tax=Polaribacter sp. MED152 TaxID=313598 RepID=UPI000068C858|nr:PepSY-associated TM helix domain-containing protein [Polaribacter sp. MED152]EAQ43001.1 putative sulfite reductase flavoprotein component [Polaribacter sp. MED152]
MGKKKYSAKKFINDVHLWLGLASGIILFLVCLSGTVLAFEHEIKDAFSEEFYIEKKSERLTIDQLVLALETNNEGTVSSVKIPENESKPYSFRVKKDPKQRRGSTVLVNPFTAEIKKVEKSSADAFLSTMFRLHRWLLLDTKIGRPIVGTATIIFLILAISGVVLWFPKKLKWKYLKQGLKIKTKAKWKRINYDLHNTLGFYACIFLIIMSITGLCWSFASYRSGLSTLIGAKVFNRSSPKFNLAQNKDGKTISLNEALAITNSKLVYEGDVSLSFPTKKNNYFSISKTNKENWSPVTSDRLYLSNSGNVLEVQYFKDKPLNVQFASLIKPIHTGEIFGNFSKIIYFLACLIATSLPVTGTIIWLNKLKKKKKKKAKGA